MSCLFCNLPEPNYKPDPQVDFICGRCVILLADADQEDLKRAYDKAKAKGFENKAMAIESFLIDEGDYKNDRKAKNSKPNLERARPLRKVRPSRHQVRA